MKVLAWPVLHLAVLVPRHPNVLIEKPDEVDGRHCGGQVQGLDLLLPHREQLVYGDGGQVAYLLPLLADPDEFHLRLQGVADHVQDVDQHRRSLLSCLLETQESQCVVAGSEERSPARRLDDELEVAGPGLSHVPGMKTPGGTQHRLQQLLAVLRAQNSLEDLGLILRLQDEERFQLGNVGAGLLTGAATIHVLCHPVQ